MRVTGGGIWAGPGSTDALKILRRAVELGVNFDRHRRRLRSGYKRTAHCRSAYPYPKGLVIATKGGLNDARPPVNGCQTADLDHLKQALDGSLKRAARTDRFISIANTVDSKVPIEDPSVR